VRRPDTGAALLRRPGVPNYMLALSVRHNAQFVPNLLLWEVFGKWAFSNISGRIGLVRGSKSGWIEVARICLRKETESFSRISARRGP